MNEVFHHKIGRGWTVRLSDEVRYVRYTQYGIVLVTVYPDLDNQTMVEMIRGCRRWTKVYDTVVLSNRQASLLVTKFLAEIDGVPA